MTNTPYAEIGRRRIPAAPDAAPQEPKHTAGALRAAESIAKVYEEQRAAELKFFGISVNPISDEDDGRRLLIGAIADTIDYKTGLLDLLKSLQDMTDKFESCISDGNGELEGDREAIAKARFEIAKTRN